MNMRDGSSHIPVEGVRSKARADTCVEAWLDAMTFPNDVETRATPFDTGNMADELRATVIHPTQRANDSAIA